MSGTNDAARDHLKPHVDSTICGKCRKEFNPGDRVTIAHIVEKTGVDLATFVKGTTMGAEYEVAHIDCRDPRLVRGLQ